MNVIPVFKPNFGDEELAHVRESLQSGWVGLGPKVAEFERRFAGYVGVPIIRESMLVASKVFKEVRAEKAAKG